MGMSKENEAEREVPLKAVARLMEGISGNEEDSAKFRMTIHSLLCGKRHPIFHPS